MSRRVVVTRSCQRAIERLSRKDRHVASTIQRELDRLAGQRRPPRDQIPGLGGRPIYKTRFRIGNRSSGRLIALVDKERVVGIVVYAKNQTENLTAKEIERFLDELEVEGSSGRSRS